MDSGLRRNDAGLFGVHRTGNSQKAFRRPEPSFKTANIDLRNIFV